MWASVLREQVPGAPRPPLHRPGLGSLGLWSLSIPTLHRVCHPPSRGLPGLCSGRAGGTEGVGSGHLQHRVSFHLCKDSLTPEHINILNDSERSWDSRQPQAPLPPPLALPPHTHSSFLLFFLPPCLLSTFLLSHSCLFLLLSPFLFLRPDIFPLFFFPFSFLSVFSPLSSPPLLFLSQDPTALVHSPTFTLRPEGAGPSVCLSIPSWAPMPSQEGASAGGSAHTVGPRGRRPSLPPPPRGAGRSFELLPFAQRHGSVGLPLPTPCWERKKPSWGVGRRGRGERFGEDFLFCIFYGHI